MNLLIIDDDEEDALIFSEVLQTIAPELKCVVADTFKVAQACVDRFNPPQFIFLDAYMSPAGGAECLVKLRAIEQLADTKIIVHCGSPSPIQVHDFTLLGADRVMPKARSYESLQIAMMDVLGIKTLSMRVKLFTHEAIVHSQLLALERILSRVIPYEIALSTKGIRSNIQFFADEQEIKRIKSNLGYTVMILDGTQWLPHL